MKYSATLLSRRSRAWCSVMTPDSPSMGEYFPKRTNHYPAEISGIWYHVGQNQSWNQIRKMAGYPDNCNWIFGTSLIKSLSPQKPRDHCYLQRQSLLTTTDIFLHSWFPSIQTAEEIKFQKKSKMQLISNKCPAALQRRGRDRGVWVWQLTSSFNISFVSGSISIMSSSIADFYTRRQSFIYTCTHKPKTC